MKLTKEVIERIRAEVQKELPSYEVTAKEVIKNNGVIYNDIVIKRPNENVAPSIHIEACITNDDSLNDISDIAKKIIEVYHSEIATESIPDFSNIGELLKDFDNVKSMLRIRLVNKEANAQLFETIPYMQFLDMAIIAVIELHRTDTGSAAIKVTNELLKYWGKTFSELLPFANANTFKVPYVLTNMIDMMMDMLNVPEALRKEMKESFQDEPSMYVLTNKEKEHGAVEICNYLTMKTIAETLQSDLCVLPSSLHEVIIVPKEYNIDIQYLKSLVREVNGTQVADEDILSNNVYVFTREHGWDFE